MKAIAYIAAFFIISTGIYGQKTATKTVTPAIQPPVKLKNAVDSVQYTLGSFLAQWISNNGFQVSDPTLFIRAMDDVFLNKSRAIPDSVIGTLVAIYQKATQKERVAKQEQQLFASLKDKPGIGTFPNGVKYAIVRAGKGPRPSETDSISVHLVAKLADGTIVEDTYQSKRPFAATPASFFPGLNTALQEMPEGSKWTLYVPSVLAYADKGTTLIPPNSALVLEVELLEVKGAKR